MSTVERVSPALFFSKVLNIRLDKTNTSLSSLTRKDLINFFYPVGSIYMSINSTSPATIWGGTWEQIENRFLLAAGSSYSAGTTGGSADAIVVSHTHSMPSSGSHGHGLRYHSYNGSQGQNNVTLNFNGYGGSLSQDINNVSVTGSGTHTHTINSTGESGTGKNMPPYLAVYIWKRTA